MKLRGNVHNEDRVQTNSSTMEGIGIRRKWRQAHDKGLTVEHMRYSPSWRRACLLGRPQTKSTMRQKQGLSGRDFMSENRRCVDRRGGLVERAPSVSGWADATVRGEGRQEGIDRKYS